jgi:hypothetical protein
VEDAPSSRALLICLLVLWTIGMAVPSSADVLALVPAYTFSVRHYVWNLATAGLFETSFVMALLNIGVAAVVCPVLERLWGSQQFIRFVLIINVACNTAILLLTVLSYSATYNERFLFVRICGFSGVNAAFSVALKQRFAERPLLNYSAVSFIKIKVPTD